MQWDDLGQTHEAQCAYLSAIMILVWEQIRVISLCFARVKAILLEEILEWFTKI